MLRLLAEQEVRPGATMTARLTEGSVSLDGRILPPGVAQHLFVSTLDEELSPLEAAPLL
jgi:DtxR family Mn-dependent transcriptional regulator